ncbi:MAG: 16S rRNA (cytosine(967)-C(5))-methyltransferase RsmB [Verrucomicrobiota bacterium]
MLANLAGGNQFLELFSHKTNIILRVTCCVSHYLPVANQSQNPRAIAVRLLLRRQAGNAYVEELLEDALAMNRLSAADRGLLQEITFGAVRWQRTLDWLIDRKTEGRTQKAALRALLQLGLYQLFWLGRVPDHAAVHETVELARHLGFGSQAGFVNAVLRGYGREREATRKQLDDLKQSDPALGYSHPQWLWERWEKRFGREPALKLLDWNNTPPPTFARVNTLKTNAEKLLPQLRLENVEYDFFRRDWFGDYDVFRLKAFPPLFKVPCFEQGMFYVQDPSTLLAVRELKPTPGETVLDWCAAPGGKTTYLAQLMNNEGRILAHDAQPGRLKLVQENCARLGVKCVEPVAADAAALRPGAFDKILVDAPCSNTGVLRRRVDLRWRIRPEEIDRLRVAQLGILKKVAPWLKAGGTLIYSTCSLEPEENGGVVKEFLAGDAQFTQQRERELLPQVDGVDGAYVAVLRKR